MSHVSKMSGSNSKKHKSKKHKEQSPVIHRATQLPDMSLASPSTARTNPHVPLPPSAVFDQMYKKKTGTTSPAPTTPTAMKAWMSSEEKERENESNVILPQLANLGITFDLPPQPSPPSKSDASETQGGEDRGAERKRRGSSTTDMRSPAGEKNGVSSDEKKTTQSKDSMLPALTSIATASSSSEDKELIQRLQDTAELLKQKRNQLEMLELYYNTTKGVSSKRNNKLASIRIEMQQYEEQHASITKTLLRRQKQRMLAFDPSTVAPELLARNEDNSAQGENDEDGLYSEVPLSMRKNSVMPKKKSFVDLNKRGVSSMNLKREKSFRDKNIVGEANEVISGQQRQHVGHAVLNQPLKSTRLRNELVLPVVMKALMATSFQLENVDTYTRWFLLHFLDESIVSALLSSSSITGSKAGGLGRLSSTLASSQLSQKFSVASFFGSSFRLLSPQHQSSKSLFSLDHHYHHHYQKEQEKRKQQLRIISRLLKLHNAGYFVSPPNRTASPTLSGPTAATSSTKFGGKNDAARQQQQWIVRSNSNMYLPDLSFHLIHAMESQDIESISLLCQSVEHCPLLQRDLLISTHKIFLKLVLLGQADNVKALTKRNMIDMTFLHVLFVKAQKKLMSMLRDLSSLAMQYGVQGVDGVCIGETLDQLMAQHEEFGEKPPKRVPGKSKEELSTSESSDSEKEEEEEPLHSGEKPKDEVNDAVQPPNIEALYDSSVQADLSVRVSPYYTTPHMQRVSDTGVAPKTPQSVAVKADVPADRRMGSCWYFEVKVNADALLSGEDVLQVGWCTEDFPADGLTEAMLGDGCNSVGFSLVHLDSYRLACHTKSPQKKTTSVSSVSMGSPGTTASSAVKMTPYSFVTPSKVQSSVLSGQTRDISSRFTEKVDASVVALKHSEGHTQPLCVIESSVMRLDLTVEYDEFGESSLVNIGCFLDFSKEQIYFSVNGKNLGLAYDFLPCHPNVRNTNTVSRIGRGGHSPGFEETDSTVVLFPCISMRSTAGAAVRLWKPLIQFLFEPSVFQYPPAPLGESNLTGGSAHEGEGHPISDISPPTWMYVNDEAKLWYFLAMTIDAEGLRQLPEVNSPLYAPPAPSTSTSTKSSMTLSDELFVNASSKLNQLAVFSIPMLNESVEKPQSSTSATSSSLKNAPVQTSSSVAALPSIGKVVRFNLLQPTPLIAALYCRHFTLARQLSQLPCCNVFRTDHLSQTPLLLACALSDAVIVENILKRVNKTLTAVYRASHAYLGAAQTYSSTYKDSLALFDRLLHQLAHSNRKSNRNRKGRGAKSTNDESGSHPSSSVSSVFPYLKSFTNAVFAASMDGFCPLHVAIMSGNHKSIKECLRTLALVFEIGKLFQEQQPLGFLTLEKVVYELVNSKTPQGNTPLLLSAKLGYLDAVVTLLDLGANPCIKDKQGTSCLQAAAHHNHEEICLALLATEKLRAEIQLDESKCKLPSLSPLAPSSTTPFKPRKPIAGKNDEVATPFFWACGHGMTEVCLQLLSLGVDGNTTYLGIPPLIHAVVRDQEETCLAIFRYLCPEVMHLEEEEDDEKEEEKEKEGPVEDQQSPNVDIPSESQQRKVSAVTPSDNLPLNEEATQEGSPDESREKRRTSSVQEESAQDPVTPKNSPRKRRGGHRQSIITGEDFPIQINAVEKKTRSSIMHFACEMGHQHLLQLLMDLGANVNCTNAAFSTPLHVAIMQGEERLAVNLLLSARHQLRVESMDQCGCTPLLLAARGGLTETCGTLLELYDAACICAQDGLTPLIATIIEGHFETAEFLLNIAEEKILLHEKYKGKTPMEWAYAYGFKSVCRRLHQLGVPLTPEVRVMLEESPQEEHGHSSPSSSSPLLLRKQSSFATPAGFVNQCRKRAGNVAIRQLLGYKERRITQGINYSRDSKEFDRWTERYFVFMEHKILMSNTSSAGARNTNNNPAAVNLSSNQNSNIGNYTGSAVLFKSFSAPTVNDLLCSKMLRGFDKRELYLEFSKILAGGRTGAVQGHEMILFLDRHCDFSISATELSAFARSGLDFLAQKLDIASAEDTRVHLVTNSVMRVEDGSGNPYPLPSEVFRALRTANVDTHDDNKIVNALEVILQEWKNRAETMLHLGWNSSNNNSPSASTRSNVVAGSSFNISKDHQSLVVLENNKFADRLLASPVASYTALHLAASLEIVPVISLLLKFGCQVNLCIPESGWFHPLRYAVRQRNVALALQLLKAEDLNVNFVEPVELLPSQMTFLHEAILNEDIEMIDLLLTFHAKSCGLFDDQGQDCWMLAANSSSSHILDVLIEYSAQNQEVNPFLSCHSASPPPRLDGTCSSTSMLLSGSEVLLDGSIKLDQTAQPKKSISAPHPSLTYSTYSAYILFSCLRNCRQGLGSLLERDLFDASVVDPETNMTLVTAILALPSTTGESGSGNMSGSLSEEDASLCRLLLTEYKVNPFTKTETGDRALSLVAARGNLLDLMETILSFGCTEQHLTERVRNIPVWKMIARYSYFHVDRLNLVSNITQRLDSFQLRRQWLREVAPNLHPFLCLHLFNQFPTEALATNDGTHFWSSLFYITAFGDFEQRASLHRKQFDSTIKLFLPFVPPAIAAAFLLLRFKFTSRNLSRSNSLIPGGTALIVGAASPKNETSSLNSKNGPSQPRLQRRPSRAASIKPNQSSPLSTTSTKAQFAKGGKESGNIKSNDEDESESAFNFGNEANDGMETASIAPTSTAGEHINNNHAPAFPLLTKSITASLSGTENVKEVPSQQQAQLSLGGIPVAAPIKHGFFTLDMIGERILDALLVQRGMANTLADILELCCRFGFLELMQLLKSKLPGHVKFHQIAQGRGLKFVCAVSRRYEMLQLFVESTVDTTEMDIIHNHMPTIVEFQTGEDDTGGGKPNSTAPKKPRKATAVSSSTTTQVVTAQYSLTDWLFEPLLHSESFDAYQQVVKRLLDTMQHQQEVKAARIKQAENEEKALDAKKKIKKKQGGGDEGNVDIPSPCLPSDVNLIFFNAEEAERQDNQRILQLLHELRACTIPKPILANFFHTLEHLLNFRCPISLSMLDFMERHHHAFGINYITGLHQDSLLHIAVMRNQFQEVKDIIFKRLDFALQLHVNAAGRLAADYSNSHVITEFLAGNKLFVFKASHVKEWHRRILMRAKVRSQAGGSEKGSMHIEMLVRQQVTRFNNGGTSFMDGEAQQQPVKPIALEIIPSALCRFLDGAEEENDFDGAKKPLDELKSSVEEESGGISATQNSKLLQFLQDQHQPESSVNFMDIPVCDIKRVGDQPEEDEYSYLWSAKQQGDASPTRQAYHSSEELQNTLQQILSQQKDSTGRMKEMLRRQLLKTGFAVYQEKVSISPELLVETGEEEQEEGNSQRRRKTNYPEEYDDISSSDDELSDNNEVKTSSTENKKTRYKGPKSKRLQYSVFYVTLPYAAMCRHAGGLKVSTFSKTVHSTDEIDQCHLSPAIQINLLEKLLREHCDNAIKAALMQIAPQYSWRRERQES